MKWPYELTITAQEAGTTLKDQLTKWYVPRRIRGNLRIRRAVLINGDYQHTSTVLKLGDKLTFNFIDEDFVTANSNYAIDNSVKVPVIFENQDLLVVNKPAGYKTHPNYTGEMNTIMNFVAAYLAPQHRQPYIIHRLDQATSGALIIAKTPVVVPILNQLIAKKIIKRTYLAWVSGAISQTAGSIDAAIGQDVNDPRKRQINGPKALPAITHWTKVHSVFQNTLVRLQLETGRTHQLRVHLASIGHPIIGDPLYNSTTQHGDEMMLHSAQVELHVPFSNEVINLTATLPAHFPVNLK
ncbi:RluA family pseudouridine synthase [Periweissella fabalis]|uniref:Pseudouridine synthase n=1 Tax=Periweissella fabalis TaxID=1070421 RepID=A0A7X6N3D0_9LACO|nr:RluA family pseudouridine synthase [Periweissella fabalis]MCM0599574.1 RluA family pseudouridine synthase [Periweissella fabalis]NKZ23879.1 RluA family pseudouridine synthase [Periweissella fabalis]